jgi:hypothetical protein
VRFADPAKRLKVALIVSCGGGHACTSASGSSARAVTVDLSQPRGDVTRGAERVDVRPERPALPGLAGGGGRGDPPRGGRQPCRAEGSCRGGCSGSRRHARGAPGESVARSVRGLNPRYRRASPVPRGQVAELETERTDDISDVAAGGGIAPTVSISVWRLRWRTTTTASQSQSSGPRAAWTASASRRDEPRVWMRASPRSPGRSYQTRGRSSGRRCPRVRGSAGAAR